MSLIDEHGQKQPLPKEVREQDPTKTSVYCQGELVYDGATGQGTHPGSVSAPGGSLNELLKWGIENSDPDELARRATVQAAPPSRIDREVLDMLLGQPIVAKMRECLGKVEEDALSAAGGIDGALGALEELEYYAEDLDHANDLAKIGGMAALQRCCVFGLGSSGTATVAADDLEAVGELREAACGVLAAMMQNNPKVVLAAVVAGIPAVLLALLAGGATAAAETRVGGLPVVQKALLALSALLRASPEAVATASADAAVASSSQRTLAAATAEAEVSTAQPATATAEEVLETLLETMRRALPTVTALSSHANLKLRRRSLFLLASLAHTSGASSAAIARAAAGDADAPSDAPLPPLLASALSGLAADDEDVRTQALRMLEAFANGASDVSAAGPDTASVPAAAAPIRARLAACGGVEALQAAVAKAAAAGQDAVPEEEGKMRRLLQWLQAA